MARHRPLYHVFSKHVGTDKARYLRATYESKNTTPCRIRHKSSGCLWLFEGVGTYCGSLLLFPLSPILFNLVIQEAPKESTRQELQSVLIADDLVPTAETRDEVVEEFKR